MIDPGRAPAPSRRRGRRDRILVRAFV